MSFFFSVPCFSFSSFPFVTQPSFSGERERGEGGGHFSFTSNYLELEGEVTVSTKSNTDDRVLKPVKVV